jgi:glycosyltransferase involved in cell wall biosynthesis
MAELRVLFVCQNDFGAPSEKQVLAFAKELAGRGHQVLISFAGDPESAEQEGATGVPGLAVHCHAFFRGRLRAEDVEVARAFAPTLVHVWNSRPPTVEAARAICRATGAPLFAHFEDDEWRVPPHPPGELWARKLAHLGRRWLSPAMPSLWWHSTAFSRRWVARHAVGLEALTPTLAREVKARLGRGCEVVLPVTLQAREVPDSSGAGPGPAAPTGDPPPPWDPEPAGAVLLITGTIWPVYLPDFMLGFRAVAELQRRGRAVRLVHAGRILPRFDPQALAAEAGIKPGTASFLGYLPYDRIPGMLRAADVLLQPGPPSEFNRLRLPSKLQAYLESGTPTVTFGVGFGELLEDRVEVLKTHADSSDELADRIAEVLDNSELRATLSGGGPQAAARLFDRVTNTDALLAVYRRGLAVAQAR